MGNLQNGVIGKRKKFVKWGKWETCKMGKQRKWANFVKCEQLGSCKIRKQEKW